MRTHGKFERGTVTEMAYQLTKTNHLIYSPTPQTSKTFIQMAQLIEFTLTKITKKQFILMKNVIYDCKNLLLEQMTPLPLPPPPSNTLGH